MISKFEKISAYINKNKFTLLLFFVIFILLGLQHSVISMYFDDYGNASLSYSYWVPNVNGTNYNISQLLEWAEHIYNGWGGRILYAILFIIPLLRHGIKAYMIAQTFVITGIIFFMYKIIKHYSKKEKYLSVLPAILFVLYTCIDIIYLRHGIYWASASVLYVWPILPFLALLYYYIKICDNIKKNIKFNKLISTVIIILLSFLTTFSQEQIGVGLLGFIILYIILHHLKQFKKYLIVDLPLLITTIISYIILFIAPGNWVRMKSNTEFAKLSLFEKVRLNYCGTLKNIFLDKMNVFMYILCFLMIYMIYKIVKNTKSKNKRILIIPLLISILQIILMYFNLKFYNNILFIITSSLWLLSFFIISIMYFKNNKIMEFTSFEAAAVGTIFCLVLSPTIGGRTGIPYIFFIILIISKLIIDVLNDNKVIKTIGILVMLYLSIIGGKNYINVYLGYNSNHVIMQLNDQILKNYKSGDVIELYKVKNTMYGSTQSYEEPSMNFWIKEYYDIPQNVTFKWIDIYKKYR